MNRTMAVVKYSVIELWFTNAHFVTNPVQVDTSVDIGWAGDIIGIEFLNLKYNVGQHVLETLGAYSGERFSFTHDKESDASYIRFSFESSVNQVPSWTTISLGEKNELEGIVTKYSID